MKIKILALLGLLVPIATMSQTEPMKGATRITVNTSDVAATNYKMTLTKLLDLGIFIEAKILNYLLYEPSSKDYQKPVAHSF